MTSPENFNQVRAAFMRRAAAPNIPPHALKLAYVLCFKYMNRETRTARAAQQTLASDLNVSSRTVRTLLDILEPLGLVIVPGHGPNRSSTYWINPDKTTPVSPLKTEKRKPTSAYNRKPASAYEPITGNPAHDKRKSDDTNTGSQLPPYLTKRTKKKNQGKKDSRASRSRAASPDVASPEEKKKEAAEEENKNQAAIDDGFSRFWSAYPKQVAIDKTRKAFAAVIRKHGTTAETLIEAANLYAMTQAGKESRWIKNPSNWLNDGDWRNPPPPGAVIDEAGNVVAVEQPSDGRQLGIVGVAEMLIEEAEGKGWDWWK